VYEQITLIFSVILRRQTCLHLTKQHNSRKLFMKRTNYWHSIIPTIFVSLLSVGCATTAGYEQMLQTWVGHSEDELISRWGAPQNVYTLNSGGKVLTYDNRRNVQIGGYTTTVPVTTYQNGTINGDVNANYNSTSTTYVQRTTPVQNINMVCITRFTIVNGVVQSWAWQGNDCKAVANKVEEESTSDSEATHTKDDFEIASDMFNKKNYSGALALFTKLANDGNSGAQRKLAEMYFAGQGANKDYTQAFYWYKKAAEKGDKQAAKNVAIMYEMGMGVEANKKEADEWYRRAK
jgi:Sel1 repeat